MRLPSTDFENAEKLLTYRAVSDALGIPYFKIQRAAKAKLFPTYRLLNGRRLLRLSEVIAAIEATRDGGSEAHPSAITTSSG
jgi:hypothetical protein